MTTLNEDKEINQPSLGKLFFHSRNALNLSLEEVSKQINLRLSILQCLENDEFTHRTISATYMKGYIRNYAKFLRLPSETWEPVIASLAETTVNDLSRGARANKAINQHNSHNYSITCISFMIAAILLILSVLWWWENYQKSNIERDHLVQEYVGNQKNTSVKLESKVPELPKLETIEEAQAVKQLAIDDIEENKHSNEVILSSKPDVESIVSTKIAEIPTAHKEILNNEKIVNSPNASNTPILQIKVTESNCWISVKNEHHQVLAQKLYNKGDELIFNENTIYDLTIGAPSNVEIIYKGEDYPLKVDGRVAKFKLQ